MRRMPATTMKMMARRAKKFKTSVSILTTAERIPDVPTPFAEPAIGGISPPKPVVPAAKASAASENVMSAKAVLYEIRWTRFIKWSGEISLILTQKRTHTQGHSPHRGGESLDPP